MFFIKQNPVFMFVTAKGATVVLAVLLIVLFLPHLGFTKGPCSCSDIRDIENYLEDRVKTRKIYEQVLEEIWSGRPMTPAEAKVRFDDLNHSGPKVAGLSPGGDVIVDSGFIKEHCNIILDSDKRHEIYHELDLPPHAFAGTVAILLLGDQGCLGKVLAESEIKARMLEEEFLKNKLKELKARCKGIWMCRCNGQRYKTPGECAASCPHASLKCGAPTCIEIGPETGKWKRPGTGY